MDELSDFVEAATARMSDLEEIQCELDEVLASASPKYPGDQTERKAVQAARDKIAEAFKILNDLL